MSVFEEKPLQFEIGEGEYRTRFTIHKLLAEEQFWGWERIRPGLGEAIQKLDLAAVGEAMASVDPNDVERARSGNTEALDRLGGLFMETVLQVAFLIPPDVIARARELVFEQTFFENRHARQPTVLLGNTEQAFDGADGFDIYEVLLRGFWRNFHGSFIKLFTRFSRRSASPPPRLNASSNSDGNDRDDSRDSSDPLFRQDSSPTES